MKHRNVVSNFIFKTATNQRAIVALFRRSHHPNIHTYQGKLAPIAGSIEANDVNASAAAVRELLEETKLIAGNDIVLEFSGKPFSFADEQAQRSWTVYPFGWTLKADESKIRTDWEHDAWEWVPPERVLDGTIKDDCVPDLDQSLRRVYFGPLGLFPGKQPLVTPDNAAGKTFLAGLKRLREDKENGSRVLATEAVKCLGQMVKSFREAEQDVGKDEQRWNSLRIAAYHLIYSGRPSMNAAISAAIIQALEQILPMTNTFRPMDLTKVIQSLEIFTSERDNAASRISEAFFSYVDSVVQTSKRINIFTLSSSSTIRSSLLHLLRSTPGLEVHLSILESRPLCEGAFLAHSLVKSLRESPSQCDLQVRVAPDSHVAFLPQTIAHSDQPTPALLLLGADRISPSGHVSNKMGSLAAAALTKALAPHTQVVLLSERDKIAKPEDLSVYEDCREDPDREMREHVPESNDPNEVSRVWRTAGAGEDVTEMLSASEENCRWSGGSGGSVKVDVENVYFEWVPEKYIDTYISEEGPLSRAQIREKSLKIARLEERIFDGLYRDDE